MKNQKRQSEAANLEDWIARNPEAPLRCLEIAKRLARHPDMQSAWAELRKHSGGVDAVFAAVQASFERAHREVQRQPAKEETEQLARVRRLAIELKEAIEQSPLPPSEGQIISFYKHGALAPSKILLCWRESDPDRPKTWSHDLSVTEILDDVVMMLDGYSDTLPPRIVARQRKDPLVSAFVRHLALEFAWKFDSELHGSIAYITTAVFDLDDERAVARRRGFGVLDKKGVQGILKDAPDWAEGLKRRRAELKRKNLTAK